MSIVTNALPAPKKCPWDRTIFQGNLENSMKGSGPLVDNIVALCIAKFEDRKSIKQTSGNKLHKFATEIKNKVVILAPSSETWERNKVFLYLPLLLLFIAALYYFLDYIAATAADY